MDASEEILDINIEKQFPSHMTTSVRSYASSEHETVRGRFRYVHFCQHQVKSPLPPRDRRWRDRDNSLITRRLRNLKYSITRSLGGVQVEEKILFRSAKERSEISLRLTGRKARCEVLL